MNDENQELIALLRNLTRMKHNDPDAYEHLIKFFNHRLNVSTSHCCSSDDAVMLYRAQGGVSFLKDALKHIADPRSLLNEIEEAAKNSN